MNIKKLDVIALYQIIDNMSNIGTHPKFAYAMAKNKKLFKSEIDAINEANKPDQKFDEFESKRIKLLREYGIKDDNGKLIIDNNNNVELGDNKNKFNEEVNKLKEEYKDIIESYKNKNAEIEKILQEEIDLDIHKVKLEYFPNNIKMSEMEILEILVDDD